MKSSEIEVGQEYAYRSSSWSDAQRVEVLATGVPFERKNYGRTQVKNGVQIKFVGSEKERVVGSRTIIRPWAEEAAEQKARAERRREAEQSRLQVAERRAVMAGQIDAVLGLHEGFEPWAQTVFGRHVYPALRGAGFEEVEDGKFVSRLPGLHEFMERGTVTEPVAQALLDLATDTPVPFAPTTESADPWKGTR